MGGIMNRLKWGGDPEEQDPRTGLTRRDVYNIRRSWAVIFKEPEKYGLKLFIGLFQLDPSTKTYFKTVRNQDEEEIRKNFQFKAHLLTVMSSLNTAVSNLHQLEVVVALMNKLGETHLKHKVEAKHFDEITVVLVNILKQDLAASDNLVASWGRFLTFIYKHIFEILCKSDHK